MNAVRTLGIAVGGLILMIVLLSAAATSVVGMLDSPLDVVDRSGTSEKDVGPPDADGEIPVRMFELYRAAAGECPGLVWTLLAGFGKVASDHGRQAADRGLMGLTAAQFAEFSDPIPAGGRNPASAADPVDAVYAAARMLCRNLRSGAADHVSSAVDDPWQATRIMELSDVYGGGPARDSFVGAAARGASSSAARIALDYAGAQLGVPYVWGGDGPDRGGAGFDCSGLTQSAYQAAGVAIPRTATAQFAVGRAVAFQDLMPGDLVFYGNPSGFIHHVAIYAGRGLVVDAPHSDAEVRFDPVWMNDYAGARRLG